MNIDRMLVRRIPNRYHKNLRLWAVNGKLPQDAFLAAVVTGDLFEALKRADYDDIRALLSIAEFAMEVKSGGLITYWQDKSQ